MKSVSLFTSKPVTLGIIASRQPVTLVVTIGNPLAAASCKVLENPSR